jgi:DNA-binding XRE family transcriptional regulator
MNRENLKEKFLEFRIEGETFESIAEKLNVSKQTLINWSKEDLVKETLSTARLVRHQKILQTYGQHRDAKIEYYSNLLKKLKDELAKRDFSNMSADKLLTVILNCENELRKLVDSHLFGGEELIHWDTNNPSFIFNPED